MVELVWHNYCKTCKTMITVIAAILMLVLLLLTLLVRQCSITDRLLVAMIFNCRCTGNMALYDFIVSKRMQLLSRHHSTRINSIRNECRQQQKYKTA